MDKKSVHTKMGTSDQIVIINRICKDYVYNVILINEFYWFVDVHQNGKVRLPICKLYMDVVIVQS